MVYRLSPTNLAADCRCIARSRRARFKHMSYNSGVHRAALPMSAGQTRPRQRGGMLCQTRSAGMETGLQASTRDAISVHLVCVTSHHG